MTKQETANELSFPQVGLNPVVRTGFVRLSDAAPLIMAKELGLFAKYGVNVSLSREVGWATIRDKIIYGELDAAQALGPMLFAANLGIGSVKYPCITGLVLNLNGNAITLSNSLKARGIHTANDLCREIRYSGAWEKHIFGVVSYYSSHYFLLRSWLSDGGIDPDKDVKIVVLPPDQMFRSIASGNLSGFCAGEPWNTLAMREEIGWSPASSLDIFPGHPEKVLMASRHYVESHEEEHIALLAAVIEACVFCDDISNRRDIIKIISQTKYLNCPEKILEAGFFGKFHCESSAKKDRSNLMVFNRFMTNEPTLDKANWILDHMENSNLLAGYPVTTSQFAQEVFRADLYREALELVGSQS